MGRSKLIIIKVSKLCSEAALRASTKWQGTSRWGGPGGPLAYRRSYRGVGGRRRPPAGGRAGLARTSPGCLQLVVGLVQSPPPWAARAAKSSPGRGPGRRARGPLAPPWPACAVDKKNR